MEARVDKRGFLATLLGGFIGGSLGLFAGGTLGYAAVAGDLDDLQGVFFIAGVGAWLGCLAGAYLVLRLAKADLIGRTILWLAVLAPPIVVGGVWIGASVTDSDDFGSGWIPYLLFLACVLVTAYLSRRLATKYVR
ncbi:MAG TPA: hypothetical protein VM784_14965 [Actinomycetota bacterium]|nr:hypothetical protein [Actinomycetota bacterium]